MKAAVLGIVGAVVLIALGFGVYQFAAHSLVEEIETKDIADPRAPETPKVPEVKPADTVKKQDPVATPKPRNLANPPWVPQAPTAKWADDTFQNGCEEASALSVKYWLLSQNPSMKSLESEITAMAKWQREKYGSSVDTDADDTAQRLLREYLKLEDQADIEVVKDISVKTLRELAARTDTVVLLPTDGRDLGNPNFKPPGPTTHMLVLYDYDTTTDEFIVQDPGTRLGKDYRYSSGVLYGALSDYPTGKHLPRTGDFKNVIVVTAK